MLITGGCMSAAGGDGIKALGSSKISACGVHIRKNAGCGVVVASKSLVMLTACTVSGNVAHGVSAVDANVNMKCSSVIGNNMCVGIASFVSIILHRLSHQPLTLALASLCCLVLRSSLRKQVRLLLERRQLCGCHRMHRFRKSQRRLVARRRQPKLNLHKLDLQQKQQEWDSFDRKEYGTIEKQRICRECEKRYSFGGWQYGGSRKMQVCDNRHFFPPIDFFQSHLYDDNHDTQSAC